MNAQARREQQLQTDARRRAAGKRKQIGQRFSLCAKEAGEHEAHAKQRGAQEHIARIARGGVDQFAFGAEHTDQRTKKEKAGGT